MLIPLVIIGAGGFGREVHDVVAAINAVQPTYDFLGFLDDGQVDHELLDRRGSSCLGGHAELEQMPPAVQYVIGIGNGGIRQKLDEWATAAARTAATVVHPSATFGANVELGPGTIVCSHVSVTTEVVAGRHVHINLNATVGHDAHLADYVTIYPGANISGNVRVGTGAMLGTGSCINQGLTIGEASVAGAGAAVVRDVPPGITVVGVPAKPLVRQS